MSTDGPAHLDDLTAHDARIAIEAVRAGKSLSAEAKEALAAAAAIAVYNRAYMAGLSALVAGLREKLEALQNLTQK